MNNQGLIGAIVQYWSVEPKARLHRRNTYFDDIGLSNLDVLRVGIAITVIATAIVVFWSLVGVIL